MSTTVHKVWFQNRLLLLRTLGGFLVVWLLDSRQRGTILWMSANPWWQPLGSSPRCWYPVYTGPAKLVSTRFLVRHMLLCCTGKSICKIVCPPHFASTLSDIISPFHLLCPHCLLLMLSFKFFVVSAAGFHVTSQNEFMGYLVLNCYLSGGFLGFFCVTMSYFVHLCAWASYHLLWLCYTFTSVTLS